MLRWMPDAGVIFAVWFLIGITGVATTAWLVLQVWDRRKKHSRTLKALTVVGVAGGACGALGALVGAVKAFRAIYRESVDPMQKARLLAEGISEALNCTAFALLLWFPSMLATLLLLRKARKSPG
jgi:biopolymer transport protein ExbB/TolQ